MSAPTVLIEPPRTGSDVATRTRVVRIPTAGGLDALLHGCPPALVFSPRERRLSGLHADLTGFAGRLAAKLAVADLLGVDAGAALAAHRDAGLARLEVLPDRSACPRGGSCPGPHPPSLRLGPAFAAGAGSGNWRVSISHTTGRAIALVARFR